jgi:hypothetical protein
MQDCVILKRAATQTRIRNSPSLNKGEKMITIQLQKEIEALRNICALRREPGRWGDDASIGS